MEPQARSYRQRSGGVDCLVVRHRPADCPAGGRGGDPGRRPQPPPAPAARIEDIDRHSYGTIAYGASITLLFALLWPARAQAMTAAVLVMAFGDGLAGLVGPVVNSPRWQVFGQTRSLAGTATMGVGTAAVLLAVAALAPATAPPVPALLAIAAIATTLEQWATAGVDNLTVPLAVAGLWLWLSPAIAA